jgi:hypothetical protein
VKSLQIDLVSGGEADRYVAGLTSWRRGDEEDWFTVFVDALYRASTGARDFAKLARANLVCARRLLRLYRALTWMSRLMTA